VIKRIVQSDKCDHLDQRNHSSSVITYDGERDSINNNLLFDQRIDLATDGSNSQFANRLRKKVSKHNALVIANFILSMKTEANISHLYREVITKILIKLSDFHSHKPFKNWLVKIYCYVLIVYTNLNLPIQCIDGSVPTISTDPAIPDFSNGYIIHT
jgi:hypothetical protein